MNSTLINYNFNDIIAHFKISKVEYSVTSFGSGHINDTFSVKSHTAESFAYLLQKINSFVFKDVDGLMSNMVSVTDHLKAKVAQTPNGNPDTEVLTLIQAKDDKYYYKDHDGNYWRMTYLLEDTRSYDLVTTIEQAFQGGMAFGRFQLLLADLDPAQVVDTIPNFLNIEKRLTDFYNAIDNDKVGRLHKVASEVEFLKSRASAMSDILNWGRAGMLPLRIIHNDTKFNNILFDSNNNVQCVIDLDTVMPGYVAYDFGDAIRSIINTSVEDEKDLEAIQLNVPLFKGFTQGYLSQAQSFLTDNELKSLIMGVLLLPYMQSVRFLTDYLEGDTYYKTHFPEHNLQRTHAQMQLFKLLEFNKEHLNNIINDEWMNLKHQTQMSAAK